MEGSIKMNQKYGTCEKPDKDNPKLICGYPIPCPHHTIIIDTIKDTRTKLQARVSDIKNVFRSIK